MPPIPCNLEKNLNVTSAFYCLHMFYTGLVNTDKYNTKVFTEGGGSRDYLYLNYKSFPVTSALKNYVRFKVLKKISMGTIANTTGGIISLQSRGSLEFGQNAFYRKPSGGSLGYFGPELKATIFF